MVLKWGEGLNGHVEGGWREGEVGRIKALRAAPRTAVSLWEGPVFDDSGMDGASSEGSPKQIC